MITYVNNSNATKYSVLFEDATQSLIEAQIASEQGDGPALRVAYKYKKDAEGNPVRDEASGLYIADDPITTIEKYFAYLNLLVNLGDATNSDNYKVLHSKGRRYTMLPLDEEYFDIDANKRTITVPKEFNSNGVAVQGDQLAEVLYFKVDRFFDAKDLDDTDVFIQWTNANGETGLSAPIVIDIESEPNKMIFGWALSEKITNKAGNIQFAVRFYKWTDEEKNKLSYSLATQTATVKINSTLDFKLNDQFLQNMAREMEQENQLLIGRIRSSNTYVTDNEDAKPPVYVLNLHDDENAKYDKTQQDEQKTVYIDLVHKDDNTDVYPLMVQALSPDSGTISYYWTYSGLDDSPYAGESATGEVLGTAQDPSQSIVEIKFIPTKDTAPQNKLYYVEETAKNGSPIYKAFDVQKLGETTPADYPLYEKVSVCTVKRVGKFYATATNSKAGANNKPKGSDVCIIPMPAQPEISDPLIKSATIIQDVENENSKVTLKIGATNIENNGTNPGTLTYQWFMTNEKDGEFEPLAAEPSPTPSLKLAYEENQDPKSIEGYYKVRINNTKNGETLFIDSSECYVSYVAEKPILSYPATEKDTQIDFSNPEKMKGIKVEISETWAKKWNVFDRKNAQYQWYASGDEIAENGPTKGGIDQQDIPIEGATEPSFIPEDKGKYYCVVTNVKNGTEASTASRVFFVV